MQYPLGIQTFSKIIERELLYVDKTAIIHDLVQQGSTYLLSRPRRFGKSLLISTLESLFKGQKKLFDGLAIAASDYDFIEYPVVMLEFSKVDVSNADDLKNYIINATNQHARSYNIALEINSYEQRFEELIFKLHQKTGLEVVLLVDEYDQPILDNLFNDSLQSVKRVMNRFYAVVKSLDRYLRFVFITGVSKFAKVSVFSGMNNLDDISMDSRYATLCGITQQEMENTFQNQIDALATTVDLTKSAVLDKIKYWYNGYRFEENAVTVYNPLSLMFLFDKQKFQNFWFDTATPTFLIELIKTKQFDLSSVEHFEVDRLFFSAIEPEHMTPGPVLLQAGYLTIVDFNDGWYRLDFPNYEVKYAFNRAIVEHYGQTSADDMRYLRTLVQTLNQHDLDTFFETLQVFFANIPHDITIKQEKYYQSLFYALFTLLGFQLDAEVRTNKGRIDCVLHTANTIYVMEFKLNDSAEAALQQIEQKQYAQKYLNCGKAITLVGVAFDKDSRNVTDYIEKTLTFG